MVFRVDLNGTSMYVVCGIIDNNAANGIASLGTIYDDSDKVLLQFTNKFTFYEWWKKQYGDSKEGQDNSYVFINFP
jgi:hypothetical protein